jgi:hypothetical protein
MLNSCLIVDPCGQCDRVLIVLTGVELAVLPGGYLDLRAVQLYGGGGRAYDNGKPSPLTNLDSMSAWPRIPSPLGSIPYLTFRC